MLRMLNVSNHVMGLDQLEEIHNLGYDLIELPEDLKVRWGQMKPENYGRVCNDIIAWAEENNIQSMHLAGFAPAVVLICADIDRIPLYYAYSERVSVDIPQPDGSIKKDSKFKHLGFFRYKTF